MTMASEDIINVKILMMGRHFLYLPVYLAQFASPEFKKLPFFGKVPSKYSVRATLPMRERDKSDAAVFKALMDAQLGASDIMFAVCDPTVLLENPDKNARMAASLISSSAFWAVNHSRQNVKLLSDLAVFNQIICYGDKTTSNLIARRIVKGDTHKLLVVNSTDEIAKFESCGEGTLAISPELLKIANLIYGPLGPEEKRAEIVLELCTTKEFSNVLTTALFTRSEVVEKHPELVTGVLTALQSALLAIHAGHPMVAACVRSNYEDAFRVEEALTIASNGNIFPETIQLRRDRWQRACEFYYISHAVAMGRTKTTLSRQEEIQVETIYAQAVDYGLQNLVTKAISNGFMGALDSENQVSAIRTKWILRQSLVWPFLIAIGFGVGNISAMAGTPSAKIMIGISWTFMFFLGWLLGKFFCYQKMSKFYASHWIFFFLSWWMLHEVVAKALQSDAHFFAGVAIDELLMVVILTLASGVLTTMGFSMRAHVNKEHKEASSTNHEH